MNHVVNKDNKLSQSQIRTINKAMILNTFRKRGMLQKKELCEELGISITTVTTIINQLVEEGYLQEKSIAKSTGGRKPVILELIATSKYAIGIDVSPHQISVIITNLLSDVIVKRYEKVNVDMTLEDILINCERILESLLKEFGIDKKLCLGIGFSLPGIVNETDLILETAPNLTASNFSFKSFEEKIGIRVFIENEANVAALAELILGSAQSLQNAVYVSITDGVGCGIITSNKIYKSSFKKAGEFGHMRISDQDITCSCGRKGCWELFASERALIRFYNEQGNGIIHDIHAFFSLYHNNDATAKVAFERYFRYLSLGIENVILALDPERVIIGGEIGSYLLDFEEDDFHRIQMNSVIANQKQNEITISKLSPQSAILGASLLPLVELFGF